MKAGLGTVQIHGLLTHANLLIPVIKISIESATIIGVCKHPEGMRDQVSSQGYHDNAYFGNSLNNYNMP